MNRRLILIAALSATAAAGALLFALKTPSPPAALPAPAMAEPLANHDPAPIMAGLRDILDGHRRVIVLLADEKSMAANERAAANQVGHALFHDNLTRMAALDNKLTALAKSSDPQRIAKLETVLAYIESGEGLFDADRLAFRESLYQLQRAAAADHTLPAIKLHKRISEDLDALLEIEKQYEKEFKQIFGRFDSRTIDLKREKWEDYLAKLRSIHSREQILKDQGVILPYPEAPAPKDEAKEINGHGLPPKTVALTSTTARTPLTPTKSPRS